MRYLKPGCAAEFYIAHPKKLRPELRSGGCHVNSCLLSPLVPARKTLQTLNGSNVKMVELASPKMTAIVGVRGSREKNEAGEKKNNLHQVTSRDRITGRVRSQISERTEAQGADEKTC